MTEDDVIVMTALKMMSGIKAKVSLNPIPIIDFSLSLNWLQKN